MRISRSFDGRRPLLLLLLAATWGCTTTTSTTPGSSGASSGGSSADGGAGSSGSNGSSGGVDTSNVTALPETAFVFVKRVRDDAYHIYSYDLATGQQTLITKLKDDGKTGTKLQGPIALSHNRKLIAFSGIYETVPADLLTTGSAQAIWSVTVDGQSFTRLSTSVPPTAQGTSPGYNVDQREPAWALDDSSVWYSFGSFTSSSYGIAGGSWLANVPASGGIPTFAKLQGPCSVTDAPSLSPDGSTIAAFRGVCTQGSDAIVLFDDPPTKTIATFPATETDSRIQWTPDGSAIFYLYQAKNQVGIVYQPVSGGAPTMVVDPNDGTTRVLSLALSPDGKTLIGGASQDNGKTSDLYSVTGFDGGGQPKLTQLTSDGQSFDPAWR